MSLLKNTKYKKVLVTARCNKLDPFRSLQYNIPRSDVEHDNVRVESEHSGGKRVYYFQRKFSYTYTRDIDGNLKDYVRH